MEVVSYLVPGDRRSAVNLINIDNLTSLIMKKHGFLSRNRNTNTTISFVTVLPVGSK